VGYPQRPSLLRGDARGRRFAAESFARLRPSTRIRFLRGGAFPGRGYAFPEGDPFFGAIIAGAAKFLGGTLVKGASKLLRGGAGAAGKLIARGAGAIAKQVPKGSARRAAAAGAAGAIGGGLLFGGGARREPGERGGYRRMDVGNVKALRRSIRRVEGFSKLARKTISFTKTVHLKKRGKR